MLQTWRISGASLESCQIGNSPTFVLKLSVFVSVFVISITWSCDLDVNLRGIWRDTKHTLYGKGYSQQVQRDTIRNIMYSESRQISFICEFVLKPQHVNFMVNGYSWQVQLDTNYSINVNGISGRSRIVLVFVKVVEDYVANFVLI